MARPPKVKPLVEIIGEGCLYLNGDGQNLTCLKADETIQAQRPGVRSHFDTAYVTRYEGTDFVQWYGRKSDGRFHPWGKIMVLTQHGKKLAKLEREEAIEKAKAARAAQLATQQAAHPEAVE